MPIVLDHGLREQISYDLTEFPVVYFCNELADLGDLTGPIHWHPEFEIATATIGASDFQVGTEHVILNPGDSIFVNGNVMHGIRQISEGRTDPVPNIVFAGSAIAPEDSMIYKKYISPIACCDELSCVVFNQKSGWHDDVNRMAKSIYQSMDEKKPCYEMSVQRSLSEIFERIFSNLDSIPKRHSTRVQIHTQIRIQKMLSYIYEHYAQAVRLADIADAANISRSEAERCFNAYMGMSPVEVLIRYRLQAAQKLLKTSNLSLQEISSSCGFNSVGYFSRLYRKIYGCAPSSDRFSGK